MAVRSKGKKKSLDCRDVGSTFSRAVENQQLVFEEEIFGDSGLPAPGSKDQSDVSQQVRQEWEQRVHSKDITN
jgi:hypothetical protein